MYRIAMLDDSPYAMLGFILAVVGAIMSVGLMGRFFDTYKMRYMLLPWLVILIGVGLFAWQVVLMMAILVGAIVLWCYLHHLKEKAYERNYPVFATDPIRSLTTTDGFDFQLHIAKVGDQFIIGMIYDTEVDLTPMTMQTRWKEQYADYASAERALYDRLPTIISAQYLPDLSPVKPGPTL